MNRKVKDIAIKVCILFALVYLLMTQNQGDIVYIYANF